MFKNILVPFDLSKQATKAYKTALDVAKKYDSKVTLLTCVEASAWHHKYYDARAENALLKQQSKATKRYIEELEAVANKNGVSMKTQVIKSKSIVNDIVNYAKSRKYDLIVMGSHGRSGFDKLLLGSVANGVSQKAKCPILIVK